MKKIIIKSLFLMALTPTKDELLFINENGEYFGWSILYEKFVFLGK